ncbi:MAG: GTPase Era [Candidatus Omnitrophota bacterium]
MTSRFEKKKTPEGFRCGWVSIIGRPNVGKSTLLNTIVGEKVAIVSKIPQTTRNNIRGIYNDERGQIIFIDTPGLVTGKDRLDRLLKESSWRSTGDVDCIIHLVDAQERVGREEEEIVRRLQKVRIPVILGLNKIDQKAKYINEYISLWERVSNKPVAQMESFILLPLSARKEINTEKLVDLIFEYLPLGPALYPPEIVCDIPQKMVIADIIREKLLGVMRDEVPHSIAVVVDSIQPKKKKTTHIKAVILIERDSQKEIVIGKDGRVLKQIGTLARLELEDLLGGKVFLETFVKTKKNWRDNLSLLQELGYDQKA